MTEKSELQKLEERVSYLASALDAAINDYFNNIGVAKETEEIYEHLSAAWSDLDSALDLIECLTKGATKLTGTEQNKPAPEIDKETFKDLLQKVTPETLQKANNAAVYFREKLEDEEGLKLPKECQAAFIAVMLFEYGKQQAHKEEQGPADPEENQ